MQHTCPHAGKQSLSPSPKSASHSLQLSCCERGTPTPLLHPKPGQPTAYTYTTGPLGIPQPGYLRYLWAAVSSCCISKINPWQIWKFFLLFYGKDPALPRWAALCSSGHLHGKGSGQRWGELCSCSPVLSEGLDCLTFPAQNV